jgi:hypothetical protein
MNETLATYVVGEVETVEKRLLGLPQVEVPLVHHFAPGVYLREAVMPAGALVIGHKHKHAGLNIVLTGSALVKIDGKICEIKAPCIIKSEAGTRKIAYVIEEMRWLNIHPTNETDLDAIEAEQIEKSAAFTEYEKTLQEMTAKKINNEVNV